MTKDKVIARVVDGKLAVENLVQWAERMNKANQLAKPKVKK